MKKTTIILTTLVLIASSCRNNKTGKVPFDSTAFPSEWRSLTIENGELVANDSPFTVLRINENKLSLHDCVRFDETGYEQTDFEYEIVDSYQAGDTIVFSLKDESDYAYVCKFIWSGKHNGLGKWIFDNDRGEEIYVVNDRVSEYQTNNNNEDDASSDPDFLSSIEGIFRNADDIDCDISLKIRQSADGYSYTLSVNGNEFRGKVSILNETIRLEDIPWVANIGPLDDDNKPVLKNTEPRYGIDAWLSENILSIENQGNIMYQYQKLDCDVRMITLEKVENTRR